jgi:hypothetical protein
MEGHDLGEVGDDALDREDEIGGRAPPAA